MRKKKGFSLIELLIVVAIILIIAAIAIPSLLRSRMLANQSAAASTVRTLVTAQATYLSTYGLKQGYAISIAALGPGGAACPLPPAIPPPTAACLIDGVLALSNKGGYTYSVTAGGGVAPAGPASFVISATPQAPGRTGINDYCATDDGVVWVNSPPVGLVVYPAPCPGIVLQN
jgi:type IV pilus assembly protein PilA